MEMTQKCSLCKLVKPASGFYKSKTSRSGFRSSCKACHTRRDKEVSRPPEYRVWVRMRSRCRDRNHTAYKYYGGRGITICERWGNFASFYSDMGPRPSSKHQIDRIDNDGNYEPENCRWVLPVINMRNNSRAIFSIEKAREIRRAIILGTSTIADLARKYETTEHYIHVIRRNERWREVDKNGEYCQAPRESPATPPTTKDPLPGENANGGSYKMRFGKHQGKCLRQVPAAYLLWLVEQEWSKKFKPIHDYVDRWRDSLIKKQAEKLGKVS